MRRGLVSVIIPTFNAAKILERSLRSVFSQSHRHHEIIVIDDGSTDNTSDILEKYSNKIIYSSQGNQGPSAARNRGLNLAEGEFVAFLDADDYWLPNFLSRCLTFLQQHPEAEAVSTGQKIITWRGEATISPKLLRDALVDKDIELGGEFFRFWAAQDHIRTGTCLIRRRLIDKAGYMREDLPLAEDLEYWGYLATFGKWGFIPEVLWVGDGAICVTAQGWLTKNSRRRKSCPTVEQWQQRIIPRLREVDWEGFRIVRGRVAQTFVYAKLLGGDIAGARDQAQRYGEDFPKNNISRLFRKLSSRSLLAWRGLALLLYCHEIQKSWRMFLRHANITDKQTPMAP